MKHCAKFSDALLPVIVELLDKYVGPGATILDPFAGTGKGVEYLNEHGYDAWGIELEPEWADLTPFVSQGDALDLPFMDEEFDGVVTSPTFGNRMSDKDLRASVAGTYAKSLGRLASPGSSCHLQWSDAYRAFHRDAWREADRVLTCGGHFLLNIKDHVRNKEVQPVSDWHLRVLVEEMGYELLEQRFVDTPSLRAGENHEARVEGEWLHMLRKDAS